VKKSTVLYFFLIIIGLLAGTRAGLSLSIPTLPEKTEPVVQKETRNLTILPNEQRSLLFVVVDDLANEVPRLRNIWLILYMPHNPKVTLMPVFPSPMDAVPPFDEELFASFHLVKEEDTASIENSFLDLLRIKEITWSGVILIDEIGMIEIANSLSSSNKLFNLSNRSQNYLNINAAISKSYLAARTDRLPSLKEQGHFYHELCWEAIRDQSSTAAGIPPIVVQLIPEHLVLDFDLEDFSGEFDLLREHGNNLLCEIPALGIPRAGKP
jgi:hypothetical protein